RRHRREFDRGRGRQHARDRRAVSLGRERAVGERLTAVKSLLDTIRRTWDPESMDGGALGPSVDQKVPASVPCQPSAAAAPTMQIALQQNIGLIYMRWASRLRGWLCRRCIDSYFWRYTLTTLFLGWWGVISFFHTLYILPSNIVSYVGARRLPRA